MIPNNVQAMRNNKIRAGAMLTILLSASVLLFGLTEYYNLPSFFHIISALVFIIINVFPSPVRPYGIKNNMIPDRRDMVCFFLGMLVLDTVFVLTVGFMMSGMCSVMFRNYIVAAFITENIVFWNGINRLNCMDTLIGTKLRMFGIDSGLIPVINIAVLLSIIGISRYELTRRNIHDQRNFMREDQRICSTKYPILLVHGAFFRDLGLFNYWGRIPRELIANGAEVYYSRQQSALSVSDSAEEIADRIREIVEETGCKKLNIIAYSKGGLDSRYAISKLGCSPYVASLTTVNTPHHGCVFADWALDNMPGVFRRCIAKGYNSAAVLIGDTSPDLLAAVNDLRASVCEQFNYEVRDVPQVYYQSVGTMIDNSYKLSFPLSVSRVFAERFDGDNDGLVSFESAKWGDKFIYLQSSSASGVSHIDMIDLLRHDRAGIDIREFYVQLVSDLREKGY